MENKDKTPTMPDDVRTALIELVASQKETDRQMKETDRQIKELRDSIKEVNQMLGGMANSNGMFAEEFFFNSIKVGDKKLFGEQFDDCIYSSKRYSKDKQAKSEQDVMLVNGDAVALIDVKYKARREDIQKLVNRLPDFKILYPHYQSRRIYLGLAAMSFENNVEADAMREGIAIVKQVGDTIVIHDENLKTF
jgi:hypothetical protein